MAAHTSADGKSFTPLEGHISINEATRAWRTFNGAKYKYCDLESGRHIRLLKMATEKARPLPRLTIHHVSLDTAPPFEALSYCWGSDKQPYRALLGTDGDRSMGYIPLTDSLATALIFLPLSCSTGYIWIDQICIDQQNDNEKGQQIGLMEEIYRKASRVLVWLGPGPGHGSRWVGSEAETNKGSHLQACWRGLRKWWHQMAVGGLSLILPTPRRAFPTGVGNDARQTSACSTGLQLVKVEDRAIDLEKLMGINVVRGIFENDWFQRAWVVQESCLATHRRALIGVFSVEWDKLTVYAAQAVGIDISKYMFHMGACAEWNLMKKIINNQPREFCGFMARYSRRFKAKEPKDKVLAFLSLWKPPKFDTKAATRKDETASDVYTRFARSVIEHTKRLDVLAAVDHKSQGCEGTSHGVTLPSWVPGWEYDEDWTSLSPVFQFQSDLSDLDHEWDASSSRSHQYCSESPTAAELSTRGRILWKVGCVCPQIKHVLHDLGNLAKTQEALGLNSGGQSIAVSDALRILLLCRGLKRTVNYAEFRPGLQGTRGTALLRQCFPGARTWSEVGSQAKRLPGDDRGLEPDNVPTRSEKLSDEDRKALAEACDWAFYRAEGRRFFKTQNPGNRNTEREEDRVGLGPGCIETGDEIAILHGASFPVALRKIEGQEKRYQLIGDCYVDDAMFGDGVNWEEQDADTIILM